MEENFFQRINKNVINFTRHFRHRQNLTACSITTLFAYNESRRDSFPPTSTVCVMNT